tara:strand:- start:174 stop:317 length:144 start_codon:yes stop_codon:yes gene_type:complete
MNKLLKKAYAKIWVPVMGRVVSVLIPLFEGKTPVKRPSYDIDSEKCK